MKIKTRKRRCCSDTIICSRWGRNLFEDVPIFGKLFSSHDTDINLYAHFVCCSATAFISLPLFLLLFFLSALVLYRIHLIPDQSFKRNHAPFDWVSFFCHLLFSPSNETTTKLCIRIFVQIPVVVVAIFTSVCVCMLMLLCGLFSLFLGTFSAWLLLYAFL